MAIAFVVNTLVQTAGTATSGSVDTSGASLLVLSIAYNGGHTPTPSDSKSNTWTALTGQVGFTPWAQIYYVANPTVGSGHTFTITGDGSAYCTAIFSAFSGVATTTPFDVENGATNSGFTDSTAQPGSITPGANNELVILGSGGPNTASATVSGYTAIDRRAQNPGVAYEGSCWYQIQTTATATNPLIVAGIGSWGGGICIAAFKAAAGGTNVTPSAVAAVFVIPTPTFNRTTTPTPTAVAQTWTIPTPVISTSVSATLTKVTGVFTIPTPAITAGTSIAMTAVAATFVVPTPSVANITNIVETAPVAAFVIPTPSVTTGSNTSIGATAVAATFVIPTPAVAGTQVTPTAVAQSWTIPTPAVTTGSTTTVNVTAVAMVATIPTPTFNRTTTPTPTAVAMICAVPTPSYTASANVLAMVVAAVFVIRGGLPTGLTIGGRATTTATAQHASTIVTAQTGEGTASQP